MFSIRLFLFIVLPMVALTCQAQVFWSVIDADGRQNWLLGTVHSEDPRLLDFPAELMEALRQSERVALELVPDGSMLERLIEAMHYDQGRLHEVLEPALYDRVVELLDQDYGMGEPAVRRMRPWAVAMTLSLPPPQTGLFMDLALSFRASAMGKDVIALETLDEQLGFFESMGKAGQIELVRQAVADHDQMAEVFEELIATYLAGDLDELEALSRAQIDQLGPEVAHHFQQVGLVDRNRVMVERALPYLRQGGLIIAVGALHLPGEDGLIELLRGEGFKVEGVY